MKWLHFSPVLLIAFLFTFVGCGSSGSSTRHVGVHNSVESTNQTTLEDYLRRLNGVLVTGSGANLRVAIRSNMSIADPNEQPLYVLNDQEIGQSFSEIYWLVNNQSIISVEAIPPSRASVYGMRGGAGVIVIKTEG